MSELDLKRLIFAQANRERVETAVASRIHGPLSRAADIKEARYSALYDLIQRAGLMEEYEKWERSFTR